MIRLLFSVTALTMFAGCASTADELSTAPDADVGSVRGQRARAIILVDPNDRSTAAITAWKRYLENERRIAPGDVKVWPVNRRAGRRLDRAEQFVPTGGRLWMVWLGGDRSEFLFEQAVQHLSEGPHHEVVLVDHRCHDGESTQDPGAVRWRGDVAELVADRPEGPRVLNTWQRAGEAVNVGILTTGCEPGSAQRLTRALSHPRDLDFDGAFALSEAAEAAGDTWATGVDLVVEEFSTERAFAPRSIDVALVDPMRHVPTGTFSRGCTALDDECESDELPQRRIWLSGFAIDTHEVTWGQYAACVEDGGCPPIDPDRCYVYDPDPGFVLRPLDPDAIDLDAAMTCANWMDADAMCRWQGKHLPTEAQWERAARGKSQTIHLTSNGVPTCDEAIHDGCGASRSPTLPGRRNTIGLADLVGNLSEWTLDWYDEDAYEHPVHVRNPVGPHWGQVKVVRGGSFYDPPTFLRLSYRYGLSPQFGYDIVGFRCAR